jgi:DNA-binding NarL/FixJ family response regulator
MATPSLYRTVSKHWEAKGDIRMIRILFVDDQPLFQEAMIPILNAQPDMDVVGQADTVREAIELSKTLRPDLVLLDFGLPDGSGLVAMQAILADRPETKIVFVTVHAESKLLIEAIRGGAKGYIVKDVSIAEFLGFIRGVHSGKAAISPGMVGSLFDVISRTPPRRA